MEADMFLAEVLVCFFTIVMAEKLTSVDFEIFGNVQGKWCIGYFIIMLLYRFKNGTIRCNF